MADDSDEEGTERVVISRRSERKEHNSKKFDGRSKRERGGSRGGVWLVCVPSPRVDIVEKKTMLGILLVVSSF